MSFRCSRCMKGPFEESDINISLFEYGDTQNPIRYCNECVFLLGLKKPNDIEETVFKLTGQKKQENKDIKKLIKDQELLDEDDNEMINIKRTKQFPEMRNGNRGVFIVKCLDNTLFCGITQNIEKSVKYMNTGSGSAYTRPITRRPVKLIYFNQVENMQQANKKRAKLKDKLSI